jgi:hypothetical protein
LVELMTGRRNQSTRRKPAPVLLCSPYIPHNFTQALTKAAVAENRQLTNCVMAQPKLGLSSGVHLWLESLLQVKHVL